MKVGKSKKFLQQNLRVTLLSFSFTTSSIECHRKMDNNHLPPAIPSIALSPAEESVASLPLPRLGSPTSPSTESPNTASSPRHFESPSRQTTTQTFLSSYSTQPAAETGDFCPPSPALSNEPLFENKNTTSLRDNLDVSLYIFFSLYKRAATPSSPLPLSR